MQTFGVSKLMSAIPPESGHRGHAPPLQLWANNGSRRASLDHLVGAAEKPYWERAAEGFSTFRVDDQLADGHLLDREITGLFVLKNPARIELTSNRLLKKSVAKRFVS